jgi:hypothetical protein
MPLSMSLQYEKSEAYIVLRRLPAVQPANLAKSPSNFADLRNFRPARAFNTNRIKRAISQCYRWLASQKSCRSKKWLKVTDAKPAQ